MTDPNDARFTGAPHAAPYPLSRLAPSYSLVSMAEEIQKADEQLATMASGKLALIAEQMQALKDKAYAILEKAKHDAALHRIPCNFEKRPHQVYHHYRRDDGSEWLSLMGPDEWRSTAGRTCLGSYRLEADMGFTRIDGDYRADDPRGSATPWSTSRA